MKLISVGDKFAMVDDEDYESLSKHSWHLNGRSNGVKYARRSIWQGTGNKKTSILMHKQILGIDNPKVTVDHIDHDGLNNQKSNLRIVTYSQNNIRRRLPRGKTSRYLGVKTESSNKKNPFRATIGVNYKIVHLGYYPNEEQAALAYNIAARKYYGEFAQFNNLCAQSLPSK